MPSLRLFSVLLVLASFLSACGLKTPQQEPVSAAPTLLEISPSETSPPVATNIPAPATTTPEPTTLSVLTLPDPQTVIWREVASGLQKPTDIGSAGDGSGRVFVLEQVGRVRILQDNQLLPSPFLDISQLVGSDSSERGLLGIAFHPKYAQNGFFFINYTDKEGNTHIARFKVSTENPNQADPSSQMELLFVRQPYGNHNGGSLAFGPDGYLYAGLGDGGSGGDPLGSGQSLNTLLGKILRLDVDGGEPYAVPVDNPFSEGGGEAEIWAYGLRNPWKISFDRVTGDLYIADVGQNQWEEINVTNSGAPGGINYGWNLMEANHDFSGAFYDAATLTLPQVEYSHAEGCSVTGGHVYRGELLPEWQGVYLYGDYCSGNIWGLLQAKANALLFKTNFSISAFGLDETGEVYLADYSGSIYRLERK